MRVLLSTLLATIALAAGSLAQAPAPAPTSTPATNLQVLPKDSTRAQILQTMRGFAAGLGVKCSFCHAVPDYASDAKDPKQIARRMLRMVDTINKDNFSGRPEVSCYTCHRGQQRPLRQAPAPTAGGGGSF